MMTGFNYLHCGNSTGFFVYSRSEIILTTSLVPGVTFVQSSSPLRHQTSDILCWEENKSRSNHSLHDWSDFSLYYLIVPSILCLSLPRLRSICLFSGPRRERYHIWTHLIQPMTSLSLVCKGWLTLSAQFCQNLFSFLFVTLETKAHTLH